MLQLSLGGRTFDSHPALGFAMRRNRAVFLCDPHLVGMIVESKNGCRAVPHLEISASSDAFLCYRSSFGEIRDPSSIH